MSEEFDNPLGLDESAFLPEEAIDAFSRAEITVSLLLGKENESGDRLCTMMLSTEPPADIPYSGLTLLPSSSICTMDDILIYLRRLLDEQKTIFGKSWVAAWTEERKKRSKKPKPAKKPTPKSKPDEPKDEKVVEESVEKAEEEGGEKTPAADDVVDEQENLVYENASVPQEPDLDTSESDEEPALQESENEEDVPEEKDAEDDEQEDDEDDEQEETLPVQGTLLGGISF